MSDDSGKPPAKKPDTERFDTTGAGRVGRDDRGNMTWEWADDEELQADDTIGAATRIRALVDPNLKIEDDDPSTGDTIINNPKGLIKGYNPYQSGALGKHEWKKKRDLRELSKWIETRRRAGGTEDGTPDDSDAGDKDG